MDWNKLSQLLAHYSDIAKRMDTQEESEKKRLTRSLAKEVSDIGQALKDEAQRLGEE